MVYVWVGRYLLCGGGCVWLVSGWYWFVCRCNFGYVDCCCCFFKGWIICVVYVGCCELVCCCRLVCLVCFWLWYFLCVKFWWFGCFWLCLCVGLVGFFVWCWCRCLIWICIVCLEGFCRWIGCWCCSWKGCCNLLGWW